MVLYRDNQRSFCLRISSNSVQRKLERMHDFYDLLNAYRYCFIFYVRNHAFEQRISIVIILSVVFGKIVHWKFPILFLIGIIRWQFGNDFLFVLYKNNNCRAKLKVFTFK